MPQKERKHANNITETKKKKKRENGSENAEELAAKFLFSFSDFGNNMQIEI